MTYDGVDIGEAIQPIQDRVETYQSNGYAVISPGDALSAGAYAVTVNSGNLNASDTLSVGSSNDEIIFDGATKSLSSATNVRINSVPAAGDGTEQYRYDVIYADNNGEVQKTEGSVTKLDSRESQNNLTRFERFKAAIPNPGTDPSVIIAAVIVNSNDTSVGTSQLRDYRVSATHKVSALEAGQLSDGIAGTGNSISAVSGDDGEYLVTSTVAILPGEQTTITSDSFGILGTSVDFVSSALPDGLTNANNAVAKVAGRVASLDQDVTLRYRSASDTEFTASSTGGFTGSYGDVVASDAMIEAKLEKQTGSDQAVLERLNVTFALEIGT